MEFVAYVKEGQIYQVWTPWWNWMGVYSAADDIYLGQIPCRPVSMAPI